MLRVPQHEREVASFVVEPIYSHALTPPRGNIDAINAQPACNATANTTKPVRPTLVTLMESSTDSFALIAGILLLAKVLFIPLFFIFIGPIVTVGDWTEAPILCAATVVIALAIKLVGSGFMALAYGKSKATSMRVAAAMAGRGVIAAVVASVGLTEVLVDHSVLSIAIVLTVETTSAALPVLKLASSLPPDPQSKSENSTVFVPGYATGGL